MHRLSNKREAMHKPNVCTSGRHVRPHKALLELLVQCRKGDGSCVFAAFILASKPTILLRGDRPRIDAVQEDAMSAKVMNSCRCTKPSSRYH